MEDHAKDVQDVLAGLQVKSVLEVHLGTHQVDHLEDHQEVHLETHQVDHQEDHQEVHHGVHLVALLEDHLEDLLELRLEDHCVDHLEGHLEGLQEAHENQAHLLGVLVVHEGNGVSL